MRSGKSFLTKTIRALGCQIWHNKSESLLCTITAATVLVAFSAGGVTIHQPLKLPIEHEGRTAGYWQLGKDATKRDSQFTLPASRPHELSMLPNLNLAHVHLRLDEIFGRDEWLGGVNALFAGNILQR